MKLVISAASFTAIGALLGHWFADWYVYANSTGQWNGKDVGRMGTADLHWVFYTHMSGAVAGLAVGIIIGLIAMRLERVPKNEQND